MSILVNKRSRIVVQGLVEAAGLQHTLAGRRYGHGRRCFVAGVGPSPLGGALEGIPVFKSVAEARAATGATTSVVYARPGHAADAIEEAAEAGMELVVCVSNGGGAARPDLEADPPVIAPSQMGDIQFDADRREINLAVVHL